MHGQVPVPARCTRQRLLKRGGRSMPPGLRSGEAGTTSGKGGSQLKSGATTSLAWVITAAQQTAQLARSGDDESSPAFDALE